MIDKRNGKNLIYLNDSFHHSHASDDSHLPGKTPANPNNIPGRIRICDLSFRKAALYPTELRGRPTWPIMLSRAD